MAIYPLFVDWFGRFFTVLPPGILQGSYFWSLGCHIPLFKWFYSVFGWASVVLCTFYFFRHLYILVLRRLHIKFVLRFLNTIYMQCIKYGVPLYLKCGYNCFYICLFYDRHHPCFVVKIIMVIILFVNIKIQNQNKDNFAHNQPFNHWLTRSTKPQKLTPLPIRNDFLIKFYVANPKITSKSIHK